LYAPKAVRVSPHFRRERALLRAGVWPVAGVDEAGRGPLAGPVAAAAVILDPDNLPKGLDDSKALTAAEREARYELILSKALAVGVGFSPAGEIDRINIRQATFAAMCRALHALPLRAAHALVDGADLPPKFHCPGETIVKGDATSMSIAAASIIAKVTRDRLMRRMHDVWPQYGFSSHMGYATRVHMEAIRLHGDCPIHRVSFAPLRQLALFDEGA
jgi:ribonuclease HII